jgi:YD repeat-containing protein
MKGYPGKVSCLAWDPRHDAVATAGGSEVVIWRFFPAGGQRATPLRHHRATVTALAYAPRGGLFVSGDRAGHLCVWTDEGALLRELHLDGEITALSWSGSGRLAAGTVGGLIQAFDFPGPQG